MEGNQVDIKWDTTGIAATDKIKIELRTAEWLFTSTTHLTMEKDAPNTGSYTWLVRHKRQCAPPTRPGDGLALCRFTTQTLAPWGVRASKQTKSGCPPLMRC